MKMIIEIQMDNAAFEDMPLTEASRILENEARKMRRFGDQNTWDGGLYDINGNRVGFIRTVKEDV
jgi:hypothetical protein